MIVSVFLYVINFLHYRALACKSLVTDDFKQRLIRLKNLGFEVAFVSHVYL